MFLIPSNNRICWRKFLIGFQWFCLFFNSFSMELKKTFNEYNNLTTQQKSFMNMSWSKKLWCWYDTMDGKGLKIKPSTYQALQQANLLMVNEQIVEDNFDLSSEVSLIDMRGRKYTILFRVVPLCSTITSHILFWCKNQAVPMVFYSKFNALTKYVNIFESFSIRYKVMVNHNYMFESKRCPFTKQWVV